MERLSRLFALIVFLLFLKATFLGRQGSGSS